MIKETQEKKPGELGYRMPAEWEPHEATWISWPRREGISFPDAYDLVLPALVQMADAIAQSEKLCINVEASRQIEVQSYLKDIDRRNISFFNIPINEPWCRDHGPIFLTQNEFEEERLIIL